jgi:hypothetical protein
LNITVLRYAQYDKVKPIYHLAEGDKFLLTARISPDTSGAGFQFTPSIGGTYKVSSVGPGGASNTILMNVGGSPKWEKPFGKEEGLYFIGVIMRNRPMYRYTYENYHKKFSNYYEIDFSTEFLAKKGNGVIENRILYKSMREDQMKNFFVLYE